MKKLLSSIVLISFFCFLALGFLPGAIPSVKSDSPEYNPDNYVLAIDLENVEPERGWYSVKLSDYGLSPSDFAYDSNPQYHFHRYAFEFDIQSLNSEFPRVYYKFYNGPQFASSEVYTSHLVRNFTISAFPDNVDTIFMVYSYPSRINHLRIYRYVYGLSPSLSFGDYESLNCDNHSYSFSILQPYMNGVGYPIKSVDSVSLDGNSVPFTYNPDTGIITVTGIVFNSFSDSSSVTLSVSVTVTNSNTGEDLSLSSSKTVDFSSCSSSSSSSYTVNVSVQCGSDLSGHFYSIALTTFKDGVQVKPDSVDFVSSPVGGSDNNVSGVWYGEQYMIYGNPVDSIDNFDVSIHIDGLVLHLNLRNLQCGDNFDVDYDSDGNQTDSHKNDLISLIKELLDNLKIFFQVVFAILKLIFKSVQLVLSLFPFIMKWVVSIVRDVFSIVFGVIYGLNHPVASLPFTLPDSPSGSGFPGISSVLILNEISFYWQLIISKIPDFVFWVIAGIMLLPIFGVRFANNSDSGSDSWSMN